MTLPSQGRKIVLLVRALIGTALIAVLTTVALVAFAVVSARSERARAVNEANSLSLASAQLRQGVVASQVQISEILDESVPEDKSRTAVQSLAQFISKQLDHDANPILRPGLSVLQPLSARLGDLFNRSQTWRDNYLVISEDITHEKTIGHVRDLLTQLRSDFDILEGDHRLAQAIAYNRWRRASGDQAAKIAADILAEQARQQNLGRTDFNGQIAELARLVEVLGGEEQFDSLADLKDNQLKPALDRLSNCVASLATDPQCPATLTPQAVENLRVAIFGQGYVNDTAHQDIQPGRGGLYQLRSNALQMRRDREQLKSSLQALSQEFESASDAFAQFARNRAETLTRQTEASLQSVLVRSIIIGGGCIVLFLWLAFLISRGIRGQVTELERARAEAETGRQTTQKLMIEQKAAADRLQAAHNSLRASEQRFRMLSASAPLGVFECDPAGRLVYANPQWEKIAGISLADAQGDGWQQVIHHEDSQIIADWKSAAEAGNDFNREFRFTAPGGDVRWVSVRTTPIRSESGPILAHVGTCENITQRKNAEAELEQINKKLQQTSRQAGMAEIATGVLHNVGNVLNSVNVSSSVVAQRLKQNGVVHLTKAVGLLREHQADIANFLANDATGRQLPGFLNQLASHLALEQDAAIREIAELQKNVEHIKEIVSTQQAYASSGGFIEMLDVRETLEDALRIHRGALMRHDVNVIKDFQPTPRIQADKHRILQILVNLLSNAKYAMKQSAVKNLTLKIYSEADRVLISVTDTGCGIAAENMTRIFSHGFTTKAEGHGFGLHSGALAARQMGGELRAASPGPGSGATFTLDLPIQAQTAVEKANS